MGSNHLEGGLRDRSRRQTGFTRPVQLVAAAGVEPALARYERAFLAVGRRSIKLVIRDGFEPPTPCM